MTKGTVLCPNPADLEVSSLEELYARRCMTPHNIDKHLPMLRHFARQCESVTELGSDIGFSTTAFLAAKPKRLLCVDVFIRPELREVLKWADKGTRVQVIQDSSLEIDPVPETDLLFIDTEHTYEQVAGELAIHAASARKYIIFHDIVSFPCIVPAIREFLNEHPEWLVREWSLIQSGLAVLEYFQRTEPVAVTQGTEPEGYLREQATFDFTCPAYRHPNRSIPLRGDAEKTCRKRLVA